MVYSADDTSCQNHFGTKEQKVMSSLKQFAPMCAVGLRPIAGLKPKKKTIIEVNKLVHYTKNDI